MTIRSFYKNRHIIEEITVSQLAKKFLSVYETERLIAMFTTSSKWSRIQPTSSTCISLDPLYLSQSSEMRSVQSGYIN